MSPLVNKESWGQLTRSNLHCIVYNNFVNKFYFVLLFDNFPFNPHNFGHKFCIYVSH